MMAQTPSLDCGCSGRTNKNVCGAKEDYHEVLLGVLYMTPKKNKQHRTGSPGDAQCDRRTETHPHANHEEKFEGLDASRPYILNLFARIERITEKVDDAFAGQPFWPDLPPDAPAYRRRFKAYNELHEEAVELFSRALELWMLSHGLQIVRGRNCRRWSEQHCNKHLNAKC